MSTVKDALGLGSATVDVAYTAMESAIKVTDEIKAKLVAAREPGVDRNKIQAEVSELQATLTSIASSASFTGENWLSVDSSDTGYNATKSIVSSFIRDGAVVSIGTTDITLTDLSLFDANGQLGLLDKDRTSGTTTDTVVTLDISALTDSTADVTELEDLIQIVDDAIQDMADGATSLGAISSRIDLQKDFVSDLMDAFQRGIGQLVDADMNAESVRLQALQTQQQLGIQALSIANGSGQNILALFRG